VREAAVAKVKRRRDRADEQREMAETPLVFLAQRGFTLDFHVSDGDTRADLRAVKDPAFVIRGYSRAQDPHAAALRAVERWRQEQDG